MLRKHECVSEINNSGKPAKITKYMLRKHECVSEINNSGKPEWYIMI